MQQIVSFRPRTTKALKLTGFRGTPHRVFYTGADGLIAEIPLGAANTVLTSTGPATTPTFEPTGVAGTLTSTESTGLGAAIAGNIVGGVAQFRSVVGAAGISITDDTESLTFALVPSLIPAFAGSTLASDGTAGGVPAPLIADRTKYLRGDGIWADAPFVAVSSVGSGASLIFSSTVAGTQLRSIVAASSRLSITQGVNDITVDVVTTNLATMGGATAVANGVKGVVPAPSAGDHIKFLRGDGSWQAPAVVGIANVGAGAGVYKNYTTQQNLRSLRSLNPNLVVVQTTDEVTFDLSSNVVTTNMVGATAVADGTAGLVTKPVAGDQLKFLRGDGLWAAPTIASNAENIGTGIDVFSSISVFNALQFRRIRSISTAISVATSNDSVDIGFNVAQIPLMVGAGELTAGAAGLVPAPLANQHELFLRGDGAWATVSASLESGSGVVGDVPVYLGTTAGVSKIALLRGIEAVQVVPVTPEVISIAVNEFAYATDTTDSTPGLVPNASAGSTTRFLNATEGWIPIPVMIGASASTAGVPGLVPLPNIGAETRFLRGDGSWVDISGIGENNTASNVGGGQGVFRSKNGVDLSFKSLMAGTAVAITSQADTLTIGINTSSLPVMVGATAIMAGERGVVPPPAAGDNSKVLYGDGVWRIPPGASGGESNSAVNMGVGVPLFIQKTGIDLEFRSMRSAHAAILVTGDPDEVFVGLAAENIPAFVGASSSVAGTGGGVPAPAAGDETKFLRGDGTWGTVVLSNPVMVGATAGDAGVAGLVPAPAAGDHVKFLRGDGTWQVVATSTAWGTITGSILDQTDLQTALAGKSGTAHTHPELVVMVGADAVTDGAMGFVPAPLAGEQDKALFGDGTWRVVASGSGSSSGGTISAPLSILTMGIAAARDGVTSSPLPTPDGFIDGCQDLDNAVTAQTTYAVVDGVLTNAAEGTTDIALGGTVSASHEYGGGYTADMAVDGNDGTRWAGSNVAAMMSWQIDFGVGTPRRVGTIEIYRSIYDPGYTPTVEGSQDGSSWDLLYTHATLGNAAADNELVTMPVASPAAYRYYRITGESFGTALSWNTVKMFELTAVLAPVYVSATRVLGYEPTTASVVVAADLGGQALNSVFQVLVSNDNGTNYDPVTMSNNGLAPYAPNARNYVGTITLPDRDASSMRVKIIGGDSAHAIYGIGLLCSIPIVSQFSDVVVASSFDDLLESINSGIASGTGTQHHISGTVVLPKDETGLHISTTFEIIGDRFSSGGLSAPGATDLALTATPSASTGTAASATDGNVGSYWQGNDVGAWIKVDLGAGTPAIISKLLLNGYYDANNALKDFILEGSNDDLAWTLLYSGTALQSHQTDQIFTFTPLSLTPFRYIRLTTVDRYGSAYATTLYTFAVFASTFVTVTDPLLLTLPQTLVDQPHAANVVVVADIGVNVIGTSFLVDISSNGGTNWDAVTLTDYGVLLPNSAESVFAGSVDLVDRGTAEMRLRIRGIGTDPIHVRGAAVGYGDKISVGSVSEAPRPSWGFIAGTLSAQADLIAALNAKAAVSHSHVAFAGATDLVAGAIGMVPAPAAGDQEKFLRGDGAWAEVAGGTGGTGSANAITGLAGLVAREAYRFNGTAWVAGVADSPVNADIIGIATDPTTLVTGGVAVVAGAAFTPGADYWLSPTTPGLIVTPEPTWAYGQVRVFVGTALSATEIALAIDLGDVMLNTAETIATKIYVHAHATLAQYYSGAAVRAVVNFDTVDAGGAYVTTGANWQFVAPRTARYMVTAATGIDTSATDETWVFIYVNGGEVASKQIGGNSTGDPASVDITDIIELSTNDVVDIRVLSGLTGNILASVSRVAIAEV